METVKAPGRSNSSYKRGVYGTAVDDSINQRRWSVLFLRDNDPPPWSVREMRFQTAQHEHRGSSRGRKGGGKGFWWNEEDRCYPRGSPGGPGFLRGFWLCESKVGFTGVVQKDLGFRFRGVGYHNSALCFPQKETSRNETCIRNSSYPAIGKQTPHFLSFQT